MNSNGNMNGETGHRSQESVCPGRAGTNRTPRQLVLGACAAAAALATSAAARAQVDEIVITAQKREQSINDIGMTVNAFSGEMLSTLGVDAVEDIPALTPGLTINETSVTGVPIYTIRGVGFQDGASSGTSTVGLYFDEVATPYSVMTRGAVFDVSRVEVLKGPQGDLYGRNTTGGQINFVSNAPTQDFEAGVTASYGRFNVFDLEGYISGPLGEHVQARLSARTTQSSKGWQRSLTRPEDELGKKDSFAARALLNFDFSDNASLLLNVHYSRDNSDNQAPAAYDGRDVGLNEFGAPYVPLNEYRLPFGAHFGETPPWYYTGNNRDADWTNNWTNPLTGETTSLRPRRDSELIGVSARLDWTFGDVSLTSITAYDSFERDDVNNGDGTAASVQENRNITDIGVFSQELRLSGDNGSLYWIAGAYYSKDHVNEQYMFFMQDSLYGDGSAAWGLPTPFATSPIYTLANRYRQESESAALYGHAEYNLTDTLRLTLGARYTDETRDWVGCTYDTGDGSLVGLWANTFGATLAPGSCAVLDDTPGSPTNISTVIGGPNVNDAFHSVERDLHDKRWMWKVGIDQAITDRVLVYATWARGFKSGGFNGAVANASSQLEPYKAEKLDSYELGVRATLFDAHVQLNGAAFYYDYTNKQEYELDVTPVGMISKIGNVPSSEIYGAEFDMQWAPTNDLELRLQASYLQTEIQEWNPVVSGNFDFASGHPINVVTQDASGRDLPSSPKWSYSAMLTYERPISDNLVVTLGADVNFVDERVDPVRPQNTIESFTLTNVRLGIGAADRAWRAMLWGRNIFDTNYYTSAIGGINGPYARITGMPATWGITMSLSF